jgi:hypothetical protein
MSTRTITLTGRPPVKINEASWPVIAEASDKEFDNQYECQANQVSEWSVRVRQHADGRAIVYARYSFESNFQNSRDYNAKRGILMPAGTSHTAICDAIREVCDEISGAECGGEDANRWPTLAADCIADMPAEELN